jgi:hypothetical protein
MKLRLGVFVLLLAASLGSAQVVVKQSPADVKTRSFDPKHPTSEMPPLKPGEAAVTESKFGCGVQIEVEVSQQPGEKPVMKITGVNATLKLGIVIWLPTDTTRKIKAHEEGHRQISEMSYKNAKQTAEKIGAKYIGRQLKVPSMDERETQPVIRRACNEFCEEYLGAIEVPSQKVQERYDDITDHGRNDVPEKDAIARAMRG